MDSGRGYLTVYLLSREANDWLVVNKPVLGAEAIYSSVADYWPD